MTTPQTPALAAAGASSSSSSIPIPKYHVFLSFGDDTSKSFSDHLYKGMVQKGIDTFWGYEKIEKGETIDTKRLKAIEESRFAVVVFSREYPSSAERLDELVKIAEMKLERVFPVFYDVEPSEVRKQNGTFGDAFALLLARQDFNLEKVNRWRKVLTEMANLAGWDLKSKYESEVIEKITKEVSDKLNITSSSEDDLVGIDFRIANLRAFLGLGESDDVRVIGIWGMPGVGKTTLAEVVFERFRAQFDAFCFIEKVRERYKKDNSLLPLQESVYKKLINDEPKIDSLRDGTKKLGAKLHSKKVLIILDDVDHEEQIKALTGDRKLKPGSRIIVTTGNKHLLEKFGENNVFQVVNLAQDEALKLLCKKTFNKDHPPKEYEEVSKLVVRYAGGLPLALEVLGCFLDGRSVKEWYSTLKRLEKFHDEDGILRVLKISFDGLRQSEKELFLDIACFFQGEPQDRVEKILESSDYGLSISIQVLVEKALIRIGGKDRCLWMHDLLQELGKEIVRRKSFQESDRPLKEPQERSRLWDPEDISYVLKENKGTDAIKGIFLTFPERETIELNDDPFQGMKKLKLLKIHNANLFSKNPGYLSNELRLLEWHRYPSTSLPSKFRPKNLVELNMPNSHIEQLWEESDMVLQMLLWINLSYCKYLTRTPSFSMTPNLERLTLEGCESLSEIHPSLEVLKKLIFLNLKGCKNLLSLPSGICGLTSLKVLNLSGCLHLDHLPEKLGSLVQLEVLKASGTGIRKVPSSIILLENLEVLSFSGCKGVALDTGECSEPIGLQLPDSFLGLFSLRSLDLSGCNLSEGAIPHDIGCLSSLQSLDLSENNFISIPDSICLLFELRTLRVNGCEKLRWLPRPPCISLIEARDCPELKTNNPNTNTIWASDSGLCRIDCSNSKEEKNNVKCHMTPIAKEHYRSQLRKNLEVISLSKNAINQSIAQIGLSRIGDGIIPEWCGHSNIGSSVTVQMSYPDVDSESMWMGFALCVIYTTPKKMEELVFDRKQIESTGIPDFGSTQFTCHFETGETRLQKSLVHDISFIGESIQLFAYIPREWFSGELSFATSITASVSISDPKVEVKKCGALVITKQNVEKFIGSLFKPDTDEENVSQHLKEITDHARRKYKVRKEMESAIEECVMICKKMKLVKWRPRSTSKGIPPTPLLIPLEEANTSSTNTNQLRSELQKLLSTLFEGHRARNYTFSSVFPVKAILPRFTYQCVGNDVLCCLPPGLYDDNSWVGFALYAVLTQHSSASLKNLDSKVQHPLLTVEMEISGYKIIKAKTDFKEDDLFGLPRLVLLYLPRVAFSEILKTSCSISSLFSTTILDEVEIDLCGIRVVYEQGLKEIIQTVIECTLQSPEVYHQRYYQNFADIQNGETSTDLCSSHFQRNCNFSNEQVPEQSSNSHRRTLEEHLLQEYYQSFHRRSTYNSCFPLTEIPEWLKCHSDDGPSGKIQLPSNLHDDSNWIGLALWASFSTNEFPASIFDNQDSNSPHYLICNLETNGGRLEPLNYQITKEELKWLSFGGFIWLCYLPRESCFDLVNQCEFLEASFGSDLGDLWAHKCALRLVYEKDEIEFGNTVLHCLNIFTDNWNLIPDSFTKGTSQHLTPTFIMLCIMAEAPVHRIDKAQWQRNLNNLLQHFFRFNLLAILTIEGHFISTFRGFDPDFWYDFGFPHRAILEWFQHQSCSSDLKMPIPQKDLCNDRNWAGFVMCASFEVHEHPTVTLENFVSTIFVSLLCHFKIQDHCLVSPPFQISREKFKWFYKRGFIWMRYMPRHWCEDILNEATSVEVSFHSPDCPSLTVEKCGIRLLYQHEVEEFKQTIIEYTTSFFDDLTPILDYIADENEKKNRGTSGISENPFLGTHQVRTFGTDNSHNSESRVLLVLDFHRDFRYNSCYPHLDIDWFSHSNSGHSVTIQHLQPCLEIDDNWIGLALFACFSNLDDPQPTTFVDHHLISQLQTERSSLEPFFYRTDNKEFKWLNQGGQFFWLSYIPKKWFLGNLNQCSSLEASFVSDNQSLFVKMCGLHLVYQHDEDNFEKTIISGCVGSLFKVNLTPILDYIADENEKKYGGTSGTDNSHNSKSREMLDFHRDFRYNSCYPHLDIDWFSHSNSGPSVTIQHLQPCLEIDDNWIGLALFACFSNLDDPQPTTFVDHHLISQLQTERGSLEPFFYPTDNEEFKWLNHGGQFFWLSYIPKKWFLGNLNQCCSLEASFVSDNQSLCVKMCGLHLVYRHGEDDFKQTILDCVESLFKNQRQPNDSKDKGKQIIE